MIFHNNFLFYFHFENRGKFPYVSLFVGNMSGCLFKRIKLLSTIHAFSSYSSFLNLLPEEEMNPIVLVMYVIGKLIR